MKKVVNFLLSKFGFLMAFSLVMVGVVVAQNVAQGDSIRVVVPVTPDFSTPQKVIETLGAYLGAVLVILVGFVPRVKTWISTSKGMKAVNIAMAAIPVIVVILMFGFKADVIQIILTTFWSIVGGLGSYALFIRPFKENG